MNVLRIYYTTEHCYNQEQWLLKKELKYTQHRTDVLLDKNADLLTFLYIYDLCNILKNMTVTN